MPILSKRMKNVLLNRLVAKATASHLGNVAARPCFSAQDVYQVLRLSYRSYVTQGLCDLNRESIYINKFLISPRARAFMLEAGNTVIGGITIVEDGELGLPLDSLYPAETRDFRKSRFKLAEVGSCCLDPKLFGSQLGPIVQDPLRLHAALSLLKILHNYAVHRELSHLLISVHPANVELFEFLGFHSFGPAKRNKMLGGAEVIPMIFAVNSYQENKSPKALKEFFINSMYEKFTYSGMFRWNDRSLMEMAIQSPSLDRCIDELTSYHEAAGLGQLAFRAPSLRETFLTATM
ncbi:MAG: hypothetical protein KDD62_13130 [Bdellovibrionales bacterium]|nr:hypothetical protein [Bdellovibrionales bacterium]